MGFALRAFRKHVSPFRTEVSESRDVLLPRLYLREIIRRIHVVIIILVTEGTETMSELVDDNRPETGVMGGGEGIGIVYSSAAVSICIGEDYDMFIRNAEKFVGEILQAQGREIPVHVESAEIGAQGSPLPFPVKRHADTADLGREGYRNEIQPACIFPERLMLKNRFSGDTGILVEFPGLLGGISLSHNSYVDAGFRISGLMYVLVRSRFRSHAPDQHIVRTDHVLDGCTDIAFLVIQFDGSIGRTRRHGKQEDILEGFLHDSGFLGGLPFLEQSRE